METQTVPKSSTWIKTPAVDLFYFGFCWIPLLAAFFLVNQTEYRLQGRYWLIAFVLLISCLHRHLTFPLVYGDSQKFRQRPRSYVLLPVFFLALTFFSVVYLRPAELTSGPVTPNLQVSKGEGINFRIYQDRKFINIPTRLGGEEKSGAEVADTLSRQLQGKIHAAAEGDRLHFTLEAPRQGDWFRIASFPGSKGLKEKLGLDQPGSDRAAVSRPLFLILAVSAGLWCLYHALMQKAGILRIYSRKGGYGKAWLDKAMIFSWAAFVLFALGSLPSVHREMARVAAIGKFFYQVIGAWGKVFPFLAVAAGLFALVLTVLYLRQELSSGRPFLWSKNLFMLSIVALLGVFFYDLIAGYAVFGFSHAVEYLAFVNIFSRKSYAAKAATSSWMARWVRHQGLAFGAFVGVSSLIFIPWYFSSRMTLEWYVVGSSFLHFIYDGWIWKVRDPAVGVPLGIQYSVPAVAS